MIKVPSIEYEKVIKTLQRDGWVIVRPFPIFLNSLVFLAKKEMKKLRQRQF
jgi:hypothetical protein